MLRLIEGVQQLTWLGVVKAPKRTFQGHRALPQQNGKNTCSKTSRYTVFGFLRRKISELPEFVSFQSTFMTITYDGSSVLKFVHFKKVCVSQGHASQGHVSQGHVSQGFTVCTMYLLTLPAFSPLISFFLLLSLESFQL